MRYARHMFPRHAMQDVVNEGGRDTILSSECSTATAACVTLKDGGNVGLSQFGPGSSRPTRNASGCVRLPFRSPVLPRPLRILS